MLKQKTIIKQVELEGKGLHKGENVKIIFKPAPIDAGVIFVRTDLDPAVKIVANIENVIDVERGTSIGNDKAKIHTVEHVLSALAGLGISNVIIEIDGKEPPAIDGSSQPFVELLCNAGIQEQDAFVKEYTVKENIILEDGDRKIIVMPSDKLRISFTIDYTHPLIKTQYRDFTFSEEDFKKEIMGARTFGFYREYENLKSRGLALGGDFNNSIVLSDDGVMHNELRFSDEFVRHKILDILGDLFLIGCGLKAHIIALKSGHAMNIKLAKIIYDKYRSERKMDVTEIQKVLPHRFPFLLVDKICEIEDGKKAVGIKNVSINESFFVGHFPERPVMPGVLIIEALAQVAGVFMLSRVENSGKLPFFAGIDEVRFRQPVIPGDQLRLEVEIIKIRGSFGKVQARALVEDNLAAEGTLMFSLVNR